MIRGVSTLVPGGAFYTWPNVTEACRYVGAKDAEDFREHLLHGSCLQFFSPAGYTRSPELGHIDLQDFLDIVHDLVESFHVLLHQGDFLGK